MNHTLTSLTLLALVALAPGSAPGGAPWAPPLASRALEEGFLSRLPPHVSKALALQKPDEGTEVRQLIARSGHHARTFNVSVANHGDIVLFSVDVHTNDSVAYLTGPDGALRRAVAFQHVDQERPLSTAEARAGFQGEKRFWAGRLHGPAEPSK